jgi:hypothetical protein
MVSKPARSWTRCPRRGAALVSIEGYHDDPAKLAKPKRSGSLVQEAMAPKAPSELAAGRCNR